MSQDSRQQGSDPIGDFQRWLLRSGVRGLGRDVRGNLRKTFGYDDAGRGDVWDSATNEPPGGEPPECEWCPLCRAARKLRDSGPGLGSHLSSAGDIFATVVQDAMDAFEAVIAAKPGSGNGTASDGGGGAQGAPATDGSPRTPAAGGAQEAAPAGGAGAAAPAGDTPAMTGDGSATADAEQQAGTGERQERPAYGPDDRG